LDDPVEQLNIKNRAIPDKMVIISVFVFNLTEVFIRFYLSVVVSVVVYC